MSDHGYDALTDELATDWLDRPYSRPSDFPSARAFVETMSRASRATARPGANPDGHDTAPGGRPLPAAGSVSPSSSTKE